METILVTGGSGLVGRHLCKKLEEEGFRVIIFTTKKQPMKNEKIFFWNVERGEIEKNAINEASYIIHLAGANIGDKRWTKQRKKLIIKSRVKSAELIFNVIKENRNKVKAFISASAVGYYGAITTDNIFVETDFPSKDFLGKTCMLWEQAADKFNQLGIRTVKIRTSIVLTSKGGALSKMIPAYKLGIGSPIGSGKQYLPWIHIEDLCRIYLKAIKETQMMGAYNASSPDQPSNKTFSHTLAQILNKPFWFPRIPSFILKLFFGEMAVMLLEGSRVSVKKIEGSNFKFRFPDLEIALNDLFNNKV